MKKVILLAIATVTLSSIFAQQNTKDEQDIRALFTTIETGWNNKSGEIMSSAFADVHDYIVVNGFYFSDFTRERNAMAHQNLFDGIFKNMDIAIRIDKIKFLTPTLAQVIALGGGYDKGAVLPKDPSNIMTVLAEKKNGVWKIISFHNHILTSFEQKDRSPMPMEVMYASWYKK